MASAGQIWEFWLAAGPDRWFEKDEAFDRAITQHFGTTHDLASSGELDGWAGTPMGAMALILVLDQFSRNMFRNDPRAFAQDARALHIADGAIAQRFDRQFALPERRFIYMPFMHSEALADQERCIALCAASEDAEGVKYAEIHADIIRRFGRFPHRNKILGRPMAPGEQEFLDAGGFAG